MNLITIDFETYYSREFSLSKITTEEYVRSDEFEVIGVAIKVNDGHTVWFSGDEAYIKEVLDTYDWANSIAVAHNAAFDAAIISWRFGIRPYAWMDTLSMARAVDGTEVGNSLKVAAERYGLGQKGTEVLNALGKRRVDFSDEDLCRYGEYCVNDVELTYKLLLVFLSKFPDSELKIINLTIKMFSEPILELDALLLEQHLEEVKERKARLMEVADVDRETLMSNDKFAAVLRSIGVEPPTKVSARTGKETWAFAKTDEGFKALAEHPNEVVQALVAARLGNKSTLEETRTQRLIDISRRGNLPVPLKYYAAHTGRWGGDGDLNLQNLPSRGTNVIKRAIIAPDGYVCINADSAQIEARVLAWLAGEWDLVEGFAQHRDVYKSMAGKIYGKEETDISKDERFVGKTTILGCGYGMGADKFQMQLKNFGHDLDNPTCKKIIQIYRDNNPHIVKLWKDAGRCLRGMIDGVVAQFGVQDAVYMHPDMGFVLPNGMHLGYKGLREVEEGKFVYTRKRDEVYIYGGKVVENICQAVARCIIGEQMVRISRKYRVALTVHDSIVCVVKEEDAETALAYITESMQWVPKWAKGLPLGCEASYAKSYGDCK